MTLWKIQGTDKWTDEEKTLFVEAETYNDAIRSSGSTSMMVTDCSPATPEEVQTHNAGEGEPKPAEEQYPDIVKNARRLRVLAALIAGIGWLCVLTMILFLIGFFTAKRASGQIEALIEVLAAAAMAILLMAFAALLRLLAGIGRAVRAMATAKP